MVTQKDYKSSVLVTITDCKFTNMILNTNLPTSSNVIATSEKSCAPVSGSRIDINDLSGWHIHNVHGCYCYTTWLRSDNLGLLQNFTLILESSTLYDLVLWWLLLGYKLTMVNLNTIYPRPRLVLSFRFRMRFSLLTQF